MSAAAADADAAGAREKDAACELSICGVGCAAAVALRGSSGALPLGGASGDAACRARAAFPLVSARGVRRGAGECRPELETAASRAATGAPNLSRSIAEELIGFRAEPTFSSAAGVRGERPEDAPLLLLDAPIDFADRDALFCVHSCASGGRSR